MPAQCPSCNKFPSLELQEVDSPESEEFDADSGEISVEVRIVRTSACCGDEMKEANISFEADVSDAITAFIDEKLEEEGLTGEAAEGVEGIEDKAEARATELREGMEMEVAVDVEEGSDTTDRKGKPITKSRYQATTFTVKATCTITDRDGNTVATEELSETIKASEMDEC